MKNWIFIFGFFIAVPALGAPDRSAPSRSSKPAVVKQAQPAALPPILKEVEEKYAQGGTLYARFEQVNEIAALNQKRKSSGQIWVKRPDKVRWETLDPDPNILVSDGRRFWFYTPPFDEGERGQVLEKRSSEVQSQLASALLAGSFSKAKGMKVQQESPSRFVLTPKAGMAGTVTRAEIEVNLEKKLIQKVILSHKGGNRSEISLTGIEIGRNLGDEMFHFTPPPNTDRVTE